MNSKNKGNANERKRCKEISLWFSKGKSDSWFWRSPISGGMATIRSKKNLESINAYGDICSTCSEGEPLLKIITIENKYGYSKDLDILSIIDSKGINQLFKKFWIQCKLSSENANKNNWGKIPILLTQRINRIPCITMTYSFYYELEKYNGTLNNTHKLIFNLDNEDLIIFRLYDFFEWCDPSYFNKN